LGKYLSPKKTAHSGAFPSKTKSLFAHLQGLAWFFLYEFLRVAPCTMPSQSLTGAQKQLERPILLLNFRVPKASPHSHDLPATTCSCGHLQSPPKRWVLCRGSDPETASLHGTFSFLLFFCVDSSKLITDLLRTSSAESPSFCRDSKLRVSEEAPAPDDTREAAAHPAKVR